MRRAEEASVVNLDTRWREQRSAMAWALLQTLAGMLRDTGVGGTSRPG